MQPKSKQYVIAPGLDKAYFFLCILYTKCHTIKNKRILEEKAIPWKNRGDLFFSKAYFVFYSLFPRTNPLTNNQATHIYKTKQKKMADDEIF